MKIGEAWVQHGIGHPVVCAQAALHCSAELGLRLCYTDGLRRQWKAFEMHLSM